MTEDIEIKKLALEIYFKIDLKTGLKVVNWEYGSKINAYFLIGVLTDIQNELLSHIDYESKEELAE